MPNQFLSDEFGDIEDYFVTDYWLIDNFVGDSLWGWGSGGSGQLGNAVFADRTTPVTTFAGGTNWKQVSCGGYFTAAIKTDGTLWTWGGNANGQLGNISTASQNVPIQTAAGGTNWKQVACGRFHVAAIKTDGTLWGWGRNNDGQIGVNNTSSPVYAPVTTFAGGNNWKQVACGRNHTAAIKTDGTLWVWGSNDLDGQRGMLGTNDIAGRAAPVTTFAGGTNWKQVACGNYHTTAIKTDGSLWVWGVNSNGQLGINNTTTRSTPITTFAGGTDWKSVAGGGYHTTAIKTDGTLWTWGYNANGELGINAAGNRTTPVTTFAGGTNWKQVAYGQFHTAAIKTDGSLWVWGGNAGRLGDNTTINRSTPVTTFAGGNNWKQVSAGGEFTTAIQSGLNVDLS